MHEFLERMLELLHSEQSELMDGIDEDGQLSDEREEALGEAIRDFVDDFGPDFDEEGQPLEEGESDRIKSGDERSRPGRTADEVEAERDAEADREAAEKQIEEVSA